MPLKIKRKRTFLAPVEVVLYDDCGKESKGSFKVLYRIIPTNKIGEEAKKRGGYIQAIVAKVHGLEIEGIEDEKELIDFIANDGALATAVDTTYKEYTIKKNMKVKIL